MKKKITGWEIDEYELSDELEKKKKGRKNKIDQLYSGYSLVATNEDNTAFVLLRKFQAVTWEGERSVFQGEPEPHDKDFQWGITIVGFDEDGMGSCTNLYLPNSRNYSGVKHKGSEVTIIFGKNSVKTNLIELERKIEFPFNFSEEQAEKEFLSLVNEKYADPEPVKEEATRPDIVSKVLGVLKYDKGMRYYERKYQKGKVSFRITIEGTTDKKLEKVIQFAETQLKNRFYSDVLLAMEPKMIRLKNTTWVEEDEKGKKERPITPAQFRKRISIECISFYENCSSEIACDDGDIFFGHIILIDVDKNGRFKRANLAG